MVSWKSRKVAVSVLVSDRLQIVLLNSPYFEESTAH